MNIKKFDSGLLCEHSLSNGMRLVIVPSSVCPRVKIQMLYDVGSAVEEPQEKGLAHLLEHMIFKGTPSIQEGAIWKIASRYGATLNAFTYYDMTSYWFDVDSNNWKPFISLLADCMENVLLDSEHLASEVKAVIQELRMGNDSPFRVILKALFGRSFPEDHPYHVTVIGHKKDLAAMTAERLRAFYKKYYVPERATLFVVGDVIVEDVVAEVERNFSHVPPSGKVFEPVFTKKYQKTTGFNLVLPKPWIKPNTFLTWLIPAAFDDIADVAELTAAVIGEGEQSLLYKRLVDKDQSADSLGHFILRLQNEAFLMVFFQPREGRVEECVRAVTEELAQLARTLVDSCVLSRLVKSRLVNHELQLERPNTSFLSLDVLTRYLQTGSIDQAFNKSERLLRVVPQMVSDFAAKYLTSELMMRADTVAMNDEQKEAWRLEQIKDQELEQQILSAHVRTLPIPTDVQLPSTYTQANSLVVPVPCATACLTLDNGFKVIIKREEDAKLCAFSFGRLSAPVQGIIEGYQFDLISDLLIEGAAGQTKQQLVDWFDDRGVQLNLIAGNGVCLQEDFADVLAKFFAMIREPDFLKQNGLLHRLFGSSDVAKQAFEKIRKQMVEKIVAQYDDPMALAESRQRAAQYPGTAYGVTLDDALKAIKSLQFSDLPDLYKKFVNVADRVLSVVGNVDADVVFDIAKTVLGDYNPLPINKNSDAATVPVVANLDVSMDRDQIYLMYVRESQLSFVGLSLERVAVDVLSYIFLSGMTSRVFKLREATGICYSCGGSLGGQFRLGLHKSQDVVFALVSPEKLEQACLLFESFIQSVFSESISQQELDDVRHSLRSRMASSVVGVMGEAHYFVKLEQFGRDEMYRQQYLELLDSLTPAILEEVAVNYGAAGQFTRVRVGNIPAVVAK